MYTEISLEQFKLAFTKCLNLTLKQQVLTLEIYSHLTAYYKKDFMRQLSDQLGLVYNEKEFLRFDYMLGKVGLKGYFVPIIVAESENDSNNKNGDIDKEIRKLLVLNCPFKVLLVRYPEIEIDLEKNPEDTYWIYAIKDFIQLNQFTGYFVAASLLKDNNKYKYVVAIYGETGRLEVFNIL
jgi:hypothetical protein